MPEHLTIPGALEWDTVERHSIATLRYAGGREHDVKYVSEVAYDALKSRLTVCENFVSHTHRKIDMVIGSVNDEHLILILRVIKGDLSAEEALIGLAP